ncbi:MAG: hypothetical protein HQK98_04335 [Nitrospirae bacterium]|nr:hypothetical protein [Nitrospirota bacterium]
MKWLLRIFGIVAIFIGTFLLIGIIMNVLKPLQILPIDPINLIGVTISLIPIAMGIYLLLYDTLKGKNSVYEQHAPGISIWLKAWRHIKEIQWKEIFVLENWKRYSWQTFTGIVCDEKQLPPFIFPIFLFYVIGGCIISFIDSFLLEEFPVYNRYDIFHLSIYVTLLVAAIFFRFVYINRKGLGVKSAQWIRSVIMFFFIVAPLYPYLSFFNSVGQQGRIIVYSGPVLKKFANYKKVSGTVVGARNLIDGVIIFLCKFGEEFLTSDHYYVTIMDTSLNKTVYLEVDQNQYKDIHINSTFTKSMRQGRFGIPYRWRM